MQDGCGDTAHAKFFMASVAYTCVQHSTVMEEQHVRHFHCWMNSIKTSIQTSQCFNHGWSSLQHLTQAVHNNTFLIPHIVTMTFPANSVLLSFSVLDEVMWCHYVDYCLDPNSKCGTPSFKPQHDNQQQEALTSSVTLAQNISGNCFPCLFICTSQHSWHQTHTDL